MEETILLMLKDEDPLNVSKQLLIADSATFRYLIEEMHQVELEFDDFLAENVTLFITLLDDRELGNIDNGNFRELNKLAEVFVIDWMKEECKQWLKKKVECARTDEEKRFVFDECIYILGKWDNKDMMNFLLSELTLLDNASFVLEYMTGLDEQDTVQLDNMLVLGRSNTEPFLRTILANLEGKVKLDENLKYLLQQMNLALSFEQNKELYLGICERLRALPDISLDDMKLLFRLSTETTSLLISRSEEIMLRTTEVIDNKTYLNLLNSCNKITDIIDAVLVNKVTSVFLVVELLLRVYYINTPSTEETRVFLTTLETFCKEKKLQKASKTFLGIVMNALNYSPKVQRVELFTILNEITNNDNLSTHHENILIKCDKFINVSPISGQRLVSTVKHVMKGDTSIPVGSVYKILYKFRHPSTVECTKAGKCGFILRDSKQDEDSILTELSTNSKDYEGTSLHLHDVVSASDMKIYNIFSGNTAPQVRHFMSQLTSSLPPGYYPTFRNKNLVISNAAHVDIQVAGQWAWWEHWLPDVPNWVTKQHCVEYDISDYVVTKR